MKALDLFCGTGCYTLALREAGIEVVAATERDDWRRGVYREHFGDGSWNHGPQLSVDVDNCIACHGDQADLWTACVGVAELVRLVGRASLPRWLWLESVREPFDAVQDALRESHPGQALFDAAGRRHLVAGPVALDMRIPDGIGGLQHPDRDKRLGLSWEAQEAALGLPAGWTAVNGATDRQRHQAIASASNLAVLRVVARAIKEAT